MIRLRFTVRVRLLRSDLESRVRLYGVRIGVSRVR